MFDGNRRGKSELRTPMATMKLCPDRPDVLVFSGGFEPINFPLFHGVWRGSLLAFAMVRCACLSPLFAEFEAERARGLEVNHQLEYHVQLYRRIAARFAPCRTRVDISGSAAKAIDLLAPQARSREMFSA
jgi:hypothetical protein